MMETALNIISWGLLVGGGVFSIIGGLGMIRLPDVFTRMHAAAVTETMGAMMIFFGLMVQAGWTIVTVKLALIVIFLIFTGPTATHALARAALGEGLIPLTDDEHEEDLSGYLPADIAALEAETNNPIQAD